MDVIFPVLLSVLILFLVYYLPYDYGRHEGEGDAEQIVENGSKDTRKHQNQFHLLNLVERFAAAVAIVGLGTFGLHFSAGFSFWFAIPNFVYFLAAFGKKFTPTLNHRRNLAEWYVSRSPKAARFDRNLVKFARLFKTTPERLNCIVHHVFFRVAMAGLSFWVLVEIFRPEWVKPIL